jgi:hypothetical protein
LSVLEQYPNFKWNDIIESVDVQQDIEPSLVENILDVNAGHPVDDSEFASFKL